MKVARLPMVSDTPMDYEILEAYLNKTTAYRRADARRIRRLLHKLAAH
jgi:hypothetical protein